MKKHLLIIALSLFSFPNLFAQEAHVVQWASEVIAFSSEDQSEPNNKRYKAVQVLGKPNKLPAGGRSAVAWAPASEENPDGEWIKVAFENPQKIRQVVIAENYNPGAINRITLYDEVGNEYPAIYDVMNVTKVGNGSRMFSIQIAETEFEVKSVKIDLQTDQVLGLNQIDAIGISNSFDPVYAEINLPENLDIQNRPESLGANINSIHLEVSPIISPDGKILYFTRAGHPENLGDEKRQDVWLARLDEETNAFRFPENLEDPINNDNHNSSFSITPDGNTMLLNNVYKSDGGMEKGLSITQKQKDGDWGVPKQVVIKDYYNLHRYSEFCLSASGKILLMTCQREDSQGGKDLYVSFYQEETGIWSVPTSLGMKVNTPEDETSPFIAADEETLYFATSGLSGYGSNDIFITRRLDNTWKNWTEPQNLGPNINTPSWDAYFTIPASGEYAYFASYHNTTGGSDIFRVKLPEENRPQPVILLQGTVYNADTQEPMSADVYYELFPEGKIVGEALATGDANTFKVLLPPGKEYGIRADAKGFFPIQEYIDLSDIQNYEEVTRDLYLNPIQKGESFRLQNLFFVRGRSQLMPESYAELDRLLEILEDNPLISIRLEGHTEPYGNPSDLKKLSKDRVTVIQSYLVERGISLERIKIKAHGGKYPLNNDEDEELRLQNRRVEVKILKTGKKESILDKAKGLFKKKK